MTTFWRGCLGLSVAALVGLVVLLGFVACGSDNSSGTSDTTTPPQDNPIHSYVKDVKVGEFTRRYVCNTLDLRDGRDGIWCDLVTADVGATTP